MRLSRLSIDLYKPIQLSISTEINTKIEFKFIYLQKK